MLRRKYFFLIVSRKCVAFHTFSHLSQPTTTCDAKKNDEKKKQIKISKKNESQRKICHFEFKPNCVGWDGVAAQHRNL